MTRPIYYWTSPCRDCPGLLARRDSRTAPQAPEQLRHRDARIYFLGNPIIWWATTLAIFYLLINALLALLKKLKADGTLWFLAGAYFLNLLPFIGIKRAMFLYHYMTALVFAILILVYLIDKLPKRKTVLAALIVASLITFIYFAPLSYGLPLSEQDYRFRLWLPSWQ